MELKSSLFTITMTLLIMMDPLGNITPFLTMMADFSHKRQTYVLLREMLIALVAMVVFFFLGNFLIQLLEISETAVWLASGMILFLTAIKILFPNQTNTRYKTFKGEPFIVPFAIPLIAGPSLLATIMLFSHMENCRPMMLTAILLSWMGAVVIFMLAPWLKRVLTQNGLTACERLTGMILVMMAIQRFMEGIRLLIEHVQH